MVSSICSCTDSTLLYRLVCQKCMEWSKPLIFGSTDIPKCFDELSHAFLLHTLVSKGVEPAVSAWFLREVRATELHLRAQSVDVDPVRVFRGVPQGSKYGPQLVVSALHQCLQPVWDACQDARVGFDAGTMYIPFVIYCDNVFIFAHSGQDFVWIVGSLASALQVAGWRLPDDRMECQTNRFTCETTSSALSRSTLCPSSHVFKLLGSKEVVNGTSHADITFKRHICTSAISSRTTLWRCAGVSKQTKLSLMFKVATSSFSWCVGAWTVNSRELTSLRSAFKRPAKSMLRMRKLWTETDEGFQRRLNRTLKACMVECRIPDTDVYVLARIFDYAGHLARAIAVNPTHLTGVALNYRNASWKQDMTDAIGHQGHAGRVSPWNWERQFHSYFKTLELDWQEVAIDRMIWLSHRSPWIQHMLGSRSAATYTGAY